jgi:nucleoside-diphosphate-sugar epimerase
VQVLLGQIYNKMYGFNICSALIFNTSGNGKNFDVFQDFCNQLKKKNNKNDFSLKVGNVENQRDFLHVDDVVNALDKIRTKGLSGKSYIISSNKLTKIKEIIKIMENISKKKFNLKIDKKLYRKFDEKIILGNNREIKKLGWKPKKNIYHILKDIIDEK